MEDDGGLELSLGLSFGGSSKAKGKNENSSDTKTEESGDRGNKLGNDFKSFLHASVSEQDLGTASQRSDSVKPQENFFNDLSKGAVDAGASRTFNGSGIWVGNNSRPAESEEDRRPEMGKRRMFFDDVDHQRKREREAHHTERHDKAKTSHISITTEDGSTAENEDVAESGVEDSTSKLISHPDDGSKRPIGAGGSSDVMKEIRGFPDSSIMNLQGQKRFNNGSSESEFKMGNVTYGIPLTGQQMNVMNVPYSLPPKESNSVGAPITSSAHPFNGMLQMMPASTGERSGNQPMTAGNFPQMFGYSPVQLPLLDKDNSWGSVSHQQQLHPSFAGRGPANSDKYKDGLNISQAAMHVTSHNASEATQYDGRTLEQAKGDGKQHAAEEGSSSQTEDVKGSSTNLRAKDASDRLAAEGLSLDFSAIKPGIAADLKFGGCGSYPNLPWVSTTAPGPDGRTISGVTYRFSASQIKIVCACHGTHMFPEEFVRHAAEPHNPDNGTGLATFPNTNPAASAQS